MNKKLIAMAISTLCSINQTAFAEENETIHLDEVSVTEKRIDDTYYVPVANTATKTDTPLLETPVSIQVVDETILRDQNAQKVSDAVRNVSGVQTLHFYGGSVERFMVRGFLQGQAGFRNGVRVPYKLTDLANVERVEVLKGPASMLYGPSDPSGIINIVTKKPQKEAAYSIEQSIGSYDNYRTEASATGAIDDAGMLTYRLDAAWQQANSYRDEIETDRYFLSPSLSFRPNDNTELNLNIEPQRDRGVYDGGQPAVGDHVADIPRSRSFVQDDLSTYKSMLVDFNGAHTFDSGVKLSGGVFNSRETTHIQDIYLFGNLSETDTDISRNFYIGKERVNSRTSWLNLTGDFKTGSLDHKLLAGVERITTDTKVRVIDAENFDSVNIYTFQHAYVDPAPFLDFVTRGDTFLYTTNYKTRSNGFFVQDQIKLNENWQLLLGARHDNIKQNIADYYDTGPVGNPTIQNRNDSKTSPRVGILYQPMQSLSFFANCAQSFGATFDYEASAPLYKPQESDQCEAGVKTELAGGKLLASASIYDLTKTNIPTPDPSNPSKKIAIGEANSKGIEFDMQGQLTDNLSMISSLALTDTEITKDNSGNQGNRLPYAPRYQYSLALNYDFNGTTKDGFSLGGAVFGSGQRYGDADNSYGDDSYAKLDLYGKYRFKLNNTKMTAQVNLNNVTNEKFYYLRVRWSNLPAEPAALYVTLRADF